MPLVNAHEAGAENVMVMCGRVLILLSSLYLCAFLGSCKTVEGSLKKEQPLLSDEIFERGSRDGPVKAVVLVLHGLNLKPARMDGWATNLIEKGALVVSMTLHGHGGDRDHMKGTSAKIWRKQVLLAINHARRRAVEKNVPLYFLGFSLGALLGLDYLSSLEGDDRVFDKMVLIAPAIATPWYSKAAVGFLSIFGGGFMLPSRSPKQYRATTGTSVAAYEALFQIKSDLLDKKFRNTNVDTLVLIDRHDELVNSSAVKKIIRDHHLLMWRLNIVNNQFAYDNYGFRHLMVDEEAVGEKLWADLSDQVLKHFRLSI